MGDNEQEFINDEQAKTLGKNVKAARLAMKRKSHNDWSQRKTAERIGMTQQGYQKIESGKVLNPKSETIKKIASVFNTTTDFLYGRFSHKQHQVIHSELVHVDIPQQVVLIPVLSSEQVVLEYIVKKGLLENVRHLPTHNKDEFEYRAIFVTTESMFNPSGTLSIEKGAIITYDPKCNCKNGDLVIVKLTAEDIEAVPRQYINEGSVKGFMAFNPLFPFVELSGDTKIYGKIKRKQVDF